MYIQTAGSAEGAERPADNIARLHGEVETLTQTHVRDRTEVGVGKRTARNLNSGQNGTIESNVIE